MIRISSSSSEALLRKLCRVTPRLLPVVRARSPFDADVYGGQ